MKKPLTKVNGFLVASNLEKSNEFLEDYYKIVSGNDDLVSSPKNRVVYN